MSPEHQLGNIESWKVVEEFIQDLPRHNAGWMPWCMLARRFIDEGNKVGLNRYFRARMSMIHFVFSTLDHPRLRREPRVTVALHPDSEISLAYGIGNFDLPGRELQYTLPFGPGFATFRRFLNQLWTATMTDPIPDELRGFSAPILTSETKIPINPLTDSQ